MALPFMIFWAIIFFARRELGWRGILICIGIWLALFLGFFSFDVSPYMFVIAQAALDVVLILIIFKGDIRIS